MNQKVDNQGIANNNLNNILNSKLIESILIKKQLSMASYSQIPNNNKNGDKITPVSSKEQHVNSLYFLSNPIQDSKGYSNISMDIEGFTKVNNKNEIILEEKNVINKNINGDNCEKQRKPSVQEIKNINLKRIEYFDNIFRCGLYMKYDNNKLYNYVINKVPIPVFKIKEYKKDFQDNFYYKCLSIFLYNRIECFSTIRQFVQNYCKDNIYELSNVKNEVVIENNILINTSEYINNMNKNPDLVTDIDIIITSYIFGINVAIYNYSFDKENLEYINSFIYEDNSNNPLMILKLENFNDYNIIFPKKATARSSRRDLQLSGIQMERFMRNNMIQNNNIIHNDNIMENNDKIPITNNYMSINNCTPINNNFIPINNSYHNYNSNQNNNISNDNAIQSNNFTQNNNSLFPNKENLIALSNKKSNIILNSNIMQYNDINNECYSRDSSTGSMDDDKKSPYDESNPFPKYTMGKDENLYFNFYKFLKSANRKGRREWPDYILLTKDYKLRNSRKLTFYRKLGIVREGKINFNKNDKNFIEPSKKIDKYIIENDRLYLARNDYEFDNVEKAKLVYKKYLIPYKNETDDIISKYHNENCHPGVDETIEIIKKNNYYWISMLLDVKKYIKECPVCAVAEVNTEINEETK